MQIFQPLAQVFLTWRGDSDFRIMYRDYTLSVSIKILAPPWLNKSAVPSVPPTPPILLNSCSLKDIPLTRCPHIKLVKMIYIWRSVHLACLWYGFTGSCLHDFYYPPPHPIKPVWISFTHMISFTSIRGGCILILEGGRELPQDWPPFFFFTFSNPIRFLFYTQLDVRDHLFL